jgi:hypothetical protein
MNPDTLDTTYYSSYLLASMVGLSSLTFSYARCVDKHKINFGNAVSAGEAFYESAVVFGISSLFRFFILNYDLHAVLFYIIRFCMVASFAMGIGGSYAGWSRGGIWRGLDRKRQFAFSHTWQQQAG